MKALIPMMLLFSLSSVAGKPIEVDCVGCGGKLTTTVKPDITVAMNLKKEIAAPKAISKDLTKENPLAINPKSYIPACFGKGEGCYKSVMCDRFRSATDRYEIEHMYDSIPTMPEFNKVDDYFTMVECSPLNYNRNIGIKAPMIHLIVDDPSKRVDYLEAIWESYDLSGDGGKLTKILNIESTLGETFLDYLYYVRKKDATSLSEGTKKSMEKIFNYACSKGAEFKKYKSVANCKKPLYAGK